MELNRAVVDYWSEHYVDRETDLCSLCGNSGIINTTNARSPRGLRVGKVNYCICPNGQHERYYNQNKTYTPTKKLCEILEAK